MKTEKVLCYSPYNMWELHGLWEITILQALKLAGADVKFVQCNGLYTECDMFWKSTNPRTENSCRQCVASVMNLSDRMKMPYEWLGEYLREEEIVKAKKWVNKVKNGDLESAIYLDWEIGKWVISSVHTHFRLSQLDTSDPEIREVFVNYLYSGLIACFGINRLMETYKPDVLFLFNGRQSSTRIALEIARKKNIRFVAHERGTFKESLKIVENEPCNSLVPITKAWEDWKDVPLNREQLDIIENHLIEREFGINLNWKHYSPKPQSQEHVRKQLCLRDDAKVWVLFTSSDDESVGNIYRKSVFSNQLDWIVNTLNYVKKHPEIDFVIRIHPNTAGQYATGNNFKQLEEMENLRPDLPSNVKMVMPEDPISTYTLMEIGTVGLVYLSSVGFHMACKGKSVIYADDYSSKLQFLKTVSSIESYQLLLDEVLEIEAGTVFHEIQKLAYRYLYLLFFRMNISFPLVKMPDAHSGVLAYNSLDGLHPGKEKNLDRIVGIIKDNNPACPPPSTNEISWTEEFEDNWFSKSDQYYKKNFDDPIVSVIIPCYNYGRYLTETVTSVVNQTYKNFEIVIINDGSEDNTQEVAETLIQMFPRVNIKLINQKNSGQPAISRNNGIKNSCGKFILPLDGDDKLAPEMLEDCIELLESNPEIDIAYTNRQDFDGVDNLVEALDYNFDLLRYQNHISHCAMYRRKVWENIGGYRENVRGFEDWDFWIAAGARGHFGKRIPKGLFLYRRHDTGVYQDVLKNADTTFSKIVLNNREVYTEQDIASAEMKLGSSNIDDTLVSVIIPTFNRPDSLKIAIKSVIDQTYKDIEILVINDAGTDVQGVVNSLGDERIKYIIHPENKGLAASRNTGLKNAKGRYISFLDDDDSYYSNHIETNVNFLKSSNVPVVYSDAYFKLIEKDTNRVLEKKVVYSNDFDRNLLLLHNIAPVQCFVIDKERLNGEYFFDESFATHEDWDYWIRVSEKNVFAHITEITSEYCHINDSSNMSNKNLNKMLETMEEIYSRYSVEGAPLNSAREKIKEQLVDRISSEEVIVTIIIPLFNKVEFTRKCFEALISNTEKDISYEIIFINNNSTDNTQEYLKSIKTQHDNIEIINNKTNFGFAKANNQAVQKASGKYVLLLNNDTECEKDWLRPLIDTVENDDRVGAVGGKLLFPNRKIQHAGVAIFNDEKLGDPLVAMHIYNGMDEYYPEVNKLKSFQALTAACLLIRKEIYEDLQGFDEEFWNGYEDVDLCFRIREKGYLLVYNPNSVLTHHESMSGSERFKKVNHNIELLHKKWLGKIIPDYIKDKSGKTHSGLNSQIKDYIFPGEEKIEEVSLTKVSIVIPTFNQWKYTKQTIESIDKFTNVPHEIIIVDNASTDGTVEKLKEYQNVKVIANDINYGFPKAVNQGILEADGNYILIANNDILVNNGWLGRMLEIAESNPSVGIVGPISNAVSGVQIDKKASYKNVKQMPKYAEKVKKENAGQVFEFPRIAFLCTLIKREVIDKIGGLDERFSPGNYEDDDFCLRTQLAGFKTIVAKDVFVHHFGSKSFRADGDKKYHDRLVKNRNIFVKKWAADPDEIWLKEKDFNKKEILFPINKDIFMQSVDRALIQLNELEYESAIESLNLAIKFYDNDQDKIKLEELFSLAGSTSLFTNKIDEAHGYFEKELQLNPNSVTACEGLGEVFYLSENFEHSKTMFEYAVANGENNENAIAGLNKVNIKLGLPEFDSSLSENEDIIMLNQAEKYIESEQYDNAKLLLNELLTNNPENLDALNDISVVNILIGEFEKASNFIERVLKIDTDNEVALENLMVLENSINNALNNSSKNSYSQEIHEAEENIEKGNIQEAKDTLKDVLLHNPQNIDALNDLVVVLILEQKYDKASEAILEVLKLDPKNEIAIENLDYLESVINNLTEE